MRSVTPIQRMKSGSQAASKSSSKHTYPRKRVSRACDECRLHKARCDGETPCVTCSRRNRVCSYNLLPIECKGSAARIRILEHRLAKAREYIHGIQTYLPAAAVPSVDLAPTSQALSYESPVIREAESSAYSTPSFTYPQVGYLAQFEDSDGVGRSLIASLLEPLSTNDQIKTLIKSQLVRSFLCDTGDSDDVSGDGTCRLPPYDTTIEVIFAAFNHNFGLCNILVEQEFRIVTQRLYSVAPDAYTTEDIEFIPLFCGVIALGFICCNTLQHTLRYEDTLKESLIYFEAASTSIANDQECTSLVKLQTTLCLVLYLLNTYKLDLVRPALRIIYASPIVQAMFEDLRAQVPGSDLTSDVRAKNLLWAIYFLDMHVSGLLGLPCLLPEPGAKLATVYAINTAAHNVANLRRSDVLFLSTLAVAMAIELTRLINRLHLNIVATDVTNLESTQNPDSLNWNDLKVGVGTWEYLLRSIFPEDDINPTLYLARHYLHCHLHLARIMLYHSFLRLHCKPASLRDSAQIADLEKGQACLIAATSAVQHISMYLEHTQSATLPFHSAYVLFISSLALIVAAKFADASTQGDILRSINTAVQILSSSNYGSFRTKQSYLDFIKILSTNVDMEVDTTIVSPPSHSGDGSTVSSSTEYAQRLVDEEGSSTYSNDQLPFPSPYVVDHSEEDQHEWGFDRSWQSN